MTRRLFVAIRIDPNPKMEEVIENLGNFPSTKTVRKENLHINLKFLGDVEEKQIEESKKILKELRDFKPFKVKLEGIGAFPSKEYIKVIWIGVKSSKIEEIAEEIEIKYAERGFKKRKRNYVPHVTLARVKNKPKQDIKKVFEKYDKKYKEIEVKEIELIESELTPKGPIYKTVEKIKSVG